MAGSSDRKPFLLRLDPATMAALKAWAAEDLRSLNGQIEYLLRSALRDAGRLPGKPRKGRPDPDPETDADPYAQPGVHTSPGDRVATASGKVTR